MDKLIYGKYILTDSTERADGSCIKNGAVLVRGNKILEIGAYENLKKKYPEAEEIGSSHDLVMPGVIDAHTHGRGISYVQKGIPYDFLENCLFDWVGAVNLPEDLDAQLMAVKHIRNGSTMMNMIQNVALFDEKAYDKAKITMDNYKKVGIRSTYAPGLKDINALANDDEDFFATLPPELQDAVKPMVFFDKRAAQDYYVELVTEMREHLHSDMSGVILGPTWAHGCTDEFYGKIKGLSEKFGGLPTHIHTLQTPHQKAYGIKKYGKSLLAHLDDLGMVDEHLVLGHAVYLNESDIQLLAEKKASITHHASCNLLMRNGIAPVYELVKNGVNVALGIDEKQLSDEEDVLEELRMIFALHRMSDYELGKTPALTPQQVISMGTVNAARTLGMEGKLGALKQGMLADLIVVDLRPVEEEPWISPDADIWYTFIHRAKGSYVKHVMVDGELVMKDRKITNIDVEGLYKEVRAYMNTAYKREPSEFKKKMMEVKKYYHAWNAHTTQADENVFYKLNSRR